MGQIVVVLVATGPDVTEAIYTTAKAAIQNAVTTFNTGNAKVNLALDTSRTQYVATG